MPLSESQRNQITSYKYRIEGYRKDLQNLRDEKRRKSEHYAGLIRGTRDPNSKRSYRQSKINEMNRLNNAMESKKREIESAKQSIQSIRR